MNKKEKEAQKEAFEYEDEDYQNISDEVLKDIKKYGKKETENFIEGLMDDIKDRWEVTDEEAEKYALEAYDSYLEENEIEDEIDEELEDFEGSNGAALEHLEQHFEIDPDEVEKLAEKCNYKFTKIVLELPGLIRKQRRIREGLFSKKPKRKFNSSFEPGYRYRGRDIEEFFGGNISAKESQLINERSVLANPGIYFAIVDKDNPIRSILINEPWEKIVYIVDIRFPDRGKKIWEQIENLIDEYGASLTSIGVHRNLKGVFQNCGSIAESWVNNYWDWQVLRLVGTNENYNQAVWNELQESVITDKDFTFQKYKKTDVLKAVLSLRNFRDAFTTFSTYDTDHDVEQIEYEMDREENAGRLEEFNPEYLKKVTTPTQKSKVERFSGNTVTLGKDGVGNFEFLEDDAGNWYTYIEDVMGQKGDMYIAEGPLKNRLKQLNKENLKKLIGDKTGYA